MLSYFKMSDKFHLLLRVFKGFYNFEIVLSGFCILVLIFAIHLTMAEIFMHLLFLYNILS